MRRGSLLPIAAMLAIVGTTAFLLLRERSPAAPREGLGTLPSDARDGQDETIPANRTTGRSELDAGTLPVRPDATREHADQASADRAAAAARAERVAALVQRLSAVVADEATARTGTDEEKEAWTTALQAALLRLQSAADSHPDSAAEILLAAEAAEADALAIRLGRALRTADHPELVSTLQTRATDAARPARTRRVALIALEFRDYAAWGEAVRAAFAADADGTVRDEAGRIMGTALAQPTYVAQRHALRAAIETGLGSTDPDQRRRSAVALLGERSPRPETIERMRVLAESDPDDAVRTAAARTHRVLTTR